MSKHKKNSPIKASLALIIASILQNGIQIITAPIFTRILSPSDYGVTNLYNSWYNLIQIIVTFSLASGVINNGLIDFKEDKDRFISSLQGLCCISTALYIILFIFYGDIISKKIGLSPILILFMLIHFPLNAAYGFWMLEQKFQYKYKETVKISLITSIMSPILGYYGIKISQSNLSTAKIIWSGLPIIIVGVMILLKQFIKGKCIINLKYWKYALSFNIPLLPHYLAQIVLASSDRIMIANLVNNSSAGLYSIAYTIGSAIQIIFNGIGSSWYPYTYQKMSENDINSIRKKSTMLVIIGGICSLGLISITPEVMQILAPYEYYEAIYVVPPVVIGIYFTFLYGFFANIEFYYKKNVKVTIASVIAATVNLILNSVFIPIYGYIAAAYTTAICYFILMVVHYLFMKSIDKREIYDIRKMFFIVSIICVLSMFITYLYSYTLIRISLIGIILLIILINGTKILSVIKNKQIISQ